MNQCDSTRRLLLEPLESRCLLAGGSGGSEFVQRNTIPRNDTPQPRTAEVSLGELRMVDKTRARDPASHSGPQVPGQRHQPIETRGAGSLRPKSAPPIVLVSQSKVVQQTESLQPEPQQAFGQTDPSATSAADPAVHAAVTIINRPPPLVSQPPRSIQQVVSTTVGTPGPASQAVNRLANAVALTAATSGSVTDSAAASETDRIESDAIPVPADYVESVDPSTAFNNAGMSDSVPSSVDQHRNESNVDATTDSDDQSSLYADDALLSGVIEPEIGRGTHWRSIAGSVDERPWELDLQSIRRLREVNVDRASSSDSDLKKLFDSAIVSWFNQSTGLIEISATGRLTLPDDGSSANVDVLLSATIGQHRSVELIARSDVASERSNADLRGSILAAIAAEQAQPLGQPAVESAFNRMSTFSVTGVALVATGLSIAAGAWSQPRFRIGHGLAGTAKADRQYQSHRQLARQRFFRHQFDRSSRSMRCG